MHRARTRRAISRPAARWAEAVSTPSGWPQPWRRWARRKGSSAMRADSTQWWHGVAPGRTSGPTSYPVSPRVTSRWGVSTAVRASVRAGSIIRSPLTIAMWGWDWQWRWASGIRWARSLRAEGARRVPSAVEGKKRWKSSSMRPESSMEHSSAKPSASAPSATTVAGVRPTAPTKSGGVGPSSRNRVRRSADSISAWRGGGPAGRARPPAPAFWEGRPQQPGALGVVEAFDDGVVVVVGSDLNGVLPVPEDRSSFSQLHSCSSRFA